MKRSTLSLLFLLLSSFVFAQKGTIKITLLDGDTKGAMVGALVQLKSEGNDDKVVSSSFYGTCKFSSLPYAQYELVAAFIGYDTLRQTIILNKDEVDLGKQIMKQKPLELDNVTVMGTAMRTSLNGDTIIYNADAFKVTDDAVAEGLLAKMPGITVDEDGEVEAQGEAVKKVYVDGKEFFGEDVSLAVKNIPADIISKIEVFNKLSDNAEFTGFDDGDSYKALNIVTRTGMNQGHFGKFIAGYSHELMYQASANYNYFRDNQRVTLIGMANNMNVRGFGSQDLVSGGRKGGRSSNGGGANFVGSSGGGGGVSTIGAAGVNYGASFNENKLKVEASYFYNLSESETIKETDRTYITDDNDLSRHYYSESSSNTDNYNHRFNGRIEYKPNNRHSLMIRPEFAYQNNTPWSSSVKDNDETSDGVTYTDLYDITSHSSTEKEAYNISNTIVYRFLIDDSGRNFIVNGRGSYSINDSDANSYSFTDYADKEDVLVKQHAVNNTTSYSVNSGFTYNEPIFEKNAMVNVNYSISHRYSDSDYKVYDWNEQLQAFDDTYDLSSSNIATSTYTTHSVGPGFMYSKPKSLQVNARVSYQYATLLNSQKVPVITPSDQRYNFDNVVYSAMVRKTFNPTNTLRMNFRSNTSNPSISNLQEVLKDSNPQNVSIGNSSLEPSYTHSANLAYNRSNITKGRTFMVMANGSYTNNAIVDSTVLLLSSNDEFLLPNGEMLDSYGEFSRPINLDGSWSVNSSVAFGTPVMFLRSNLNTNMGVGYSESPSIFNGIENLTMKTSYKAGVSLGSNISKNVDFTLSYNAGYNVVDYKYDLKGATSQDNKSFTHKASGNFKFVIWYGITLSGSATYTQYGGITDDYKQEYVHCNLYLGKKLFKNNRGEITVGVNDLFNQSQTFVRNITDTYVENVITNAIGRYYGIKFTFDLRSFQGNSPEGGRGQRGSGYQGGGYGGGRPMGGGMH